MRNAIFLTGRAVFGFIFIGVFLILGACSTTRQDGPPSYNVDETKIPNAVPKKERLSKYGNKPVYKVFGKNYHVMKSSKNYEAQGIASWYGTKFHKQRTSNGETYDMLAMTAAHKTLPLPTYLQVTNLSNGKKVIVKVNDRGPFEGNRLIDLSYVAAKKLGMIGHGTAHVDIKAIDSVNYDKNETQDTDTQPHFNDFFIAKDNTVYVPPVAHPVMAKQQAKSSAVYLQVGAFKNKHYAENLRKRLLPVVSSPIKIANSKHFYRVQIGPIKNTAMANHIHKTLKAEGLTSKEFHLEV